MLDDPNSSKEAMRRGSEHVGSRSLHYVVLMLYDLQSVQMFQLQSAGQGGGLNIRSGSELPGPRVSPHLT